MVKNIKSDICKSSNYAKNFLISITKVGFKHESFLIHVALKKIEKKREEILYLYFHAYICASVCVCV